MFFVLSFIACCSFIHCAENNIPKGSPIEVTENKEGFLATYKNGEQIDIYRVTPNYFKVAWYINNKPTSSTWTVRDDALWQRITQVFHETPPLTPPLRLQFIGR